MAEQTAVALNDRKNAEVAALRRRSLSLCALRDDAFRSGQQAMAEALSRAILQLENVTTLVMTVRAMR